MIKKLLASEMSHFTRLQYSAKKLLISIAVYELTVPLLFTFINAHIWRQSENFISPALYSLGYCLSLPLAFFTSGYLLRYFNLKRIFQLGLIGQGLMAALVFFQSDISNMLLLLFGFLQGFPLGFYWANRSYLTVQTTNDDDRNYFTGIETSVSSISSVLTPLVTGWSIYFLSNSSHFTISQSYQILLILSFILLFIGGRVINGLEIHNPISSRLRIKDVSKKYQVVRLIELVRGVQNALELFLPSLIVFVFVKEESILGTIESISALLLTIILYYIGKFSNSKHRIHLVKMSVYILILSACLFALHPQVITAIIYLIVVGISALVSFLGLNPMEMKVIDQEDGGDDRHNYSYIIDRELFLNIGRFIGIGIFIGSYYIWKDNVVRYVPLVIASIQLLTLNLSQRIND